MSICPYINITQELTDIGVKPVGYVRHLDKAIKKIPQTPIKTGVPVIL